MSRDEKIIFCVHQGFDPDKNKFHECIYNAGCGFWSPKHDDCKFNVLFNVVVGGGEPSVPVAPSSASSSLGDLASRYPLLEVSADNRVIKPRKFLGDAWGEINEELRREGYTWVSAGKDGRWEFQGAATPPQAGGEPATEKQINYLQQLGGFVKPGLTKNEASKLIEHLKGQQKK